MSEAVSWKRLNSLSGLVIRQDKVLCIARTVRCSARIASRLRVVTSIQSSRTASRSSSSSALSLSASSIVLSIFRAARLQRRQVVATRCKHVPSGLSLHSKLRVIPERIRLLPIARSQDEPTIGRLRLRPTGVTKAHLRKQCRCHREKFDNRPRPVLHDHTPSDLLDALLPSSNQTVSRQSRGPATPSTTWHPLGIGQSASSWGTGTSAKVVGSGGRNQDDPSFMSPVLSGAGSGEPLPLGARARPP